MHMSMNFFVYHVTRSTNSRIIFGGIHISGIYYKTLKGIGKIQLLSELTNLLNLWISKFHGSLKIEIIKPWILILM